MSPGSPAARAGLYPADPIVACGGIDVENAGDLQALMTGELLQAPIETNLLWADEVVAIDLEPLVVTR